ncbi:MAG: hypothetical protein ACYC8T_34770 [Myxococcaceae bacterium]
MGDKSAVFRPVGRVSFAGGFCPTHPCPIIFQAFQFGSTTDFKINGTTVSDVKILNSGRFEGTVALDGTITFVSTGRFDVNGLVGGDAVSRQGRPTRLTGSLLRSARELRLEGQIAVDEGSATFDLVASIDDSAPVPIIDAITPGECGVPVHFSAANAFDPDGDQITSRLWFEEFPDKRVELGTGPTLDLAFAKGRHLIGLRAADASGRSNMGYFGLNVVDTLPPVIDSIEVSRACLWPPNHKLLPVVLGVDVVTTVRDACDGVPAISFTSVWSSQTANGAGDGNTEPDAIVAEEGKLVCLRAERAGPIPEGRIYDATVTAADREGHTASGTIKIAVSHDQRPSSRCPEISRDALVEDGDPRCTATPPGSPSGPQANSPSTGGAGCQSVPGTTVLLAALLVLLAMAWRRDQGAA